MQVLHVPTVLGAAVPTYNVPGVTGELKFTRSAGGNFSWQDHELE